MKSVELTVSGYVQGVGYRRAVQRIAQKLGVSGYVRNMPDGTVKMVAEADQKALSVIQWVRSRDNSLAASHR